MASITLDDDLVAAARAGTIDLNTADELHKARRTLDGKRRAIRRRQDEIDALNETATVLVAAEEFALNPPQHANS